MRKKIGELLVEAGVTTPADVNAALGSQRAKHAGQKLGQVLVSMGRVTQQHVARALSVQYELPFIELPQIPASVSSMLPMEFQSEHRIVPFQLEREGKVEKLHLAIADPSNMDVVEELRFQINKPLRVFVAAIDDIDDVLSALRGDAVAELDPLDDVDVDDAASEPPAAAAAPVPAPAASNEPDWLIEEPPPVAVGAPFDDDKPGPPVMQAQPPADLPPEWDIFDTGPVTAAAPPPTAPTSAVGPAARVGAAPSSAPIPSMAPSIAPPVSAAPRSTPPSTPAVTAGASPRPSASSPPGAASATSAAASRPAPAIPPLASVPPVSLAAEPPRPTPPVAVPAFTGSAPKPPPIALADAPPSITPGAFPALQPTPPPVADPLGSAMASSSDLDDLLGEVTAVHAPTPGTQPLTRPALPPPPGSAQKAAHVHKFEAPPRTTPSSGTPAAIPGATTSAPPPSNLSAPPPIAEVKAPIEFSDEDLKILENLERMALGDEPTLDSAKVKPAQMVASLIRLLMKKGVIAETEFLEELGRK